ncbi:VOC family protein [Planctomycetota bacterium]
MKHPPDLKQHLPIQGNMVFLYYRDLQRASDFYELIIGLELVADYGFAKILRMSPTSFVGLVDEKEGMHTADEPKTVTLSFVTEDIEKWYVRLQRDGVKMRSPLANATRHPTRGFVALDPEGYFLEFETFLDDPQNEKLLHAIKDILPFYPPNLLYSTPNQMRVQAGIFWLYYNDVPAAQRFYEDVFGMELLVDQGFAKIYYSSPTGFIGLVDQAQGLHKFSEQKAVTVCFLTEQIEQWFQHVQDKGLEIRSPLSDEGRVPVRTFVTYDPAGYFLEFDHFLPHEKNADILKSLKK